MATKELERTSTTRFEKCGSEDLVAHLRTFKTVAQDDIDKMRLFKCFLHVNSTSNQIIVPCLRWN